MRSSTHPKPGLRKVFPKKKGRDWLVEKDPGGDSPAEQLRCMHIRKVRLRPVILAGAPIAAAPLRSSSHPFIFSSTLAYVHENLAAGVARGHLGLRDSILRHDLMPQI